MTSPKTSKVQQAFQNQNVLKNFDFARHVDGMPFVKICHYETDFS